MAQPSFKLFAGSASQGLGKELAATLGISLGASRHSSLPNGEPYVELNEPLEGLDVYLLQSLPSPASWYLLELLLMANIAQRSRARRIHAIIPYYSYGRQDQGHPGKPFAARTVAQLLAVSGVAKVILLHAHSPLVHTLFDIPVVELSPISLFAEQICLISKGENLCFLAPDAGAHALALDYADTAEADAALVLKKRESAHQVSAEGLLGDVHGKHVWVVDDCIQTGQTLAQAVHLAKQSGALSVSAAITHVDPSTNALPILKSLGLRHFFTTNSCESPYLGVLKAHALSMSPLLKEVVYDYPT